MWKYTLLLVVLAAGCNLNMSGSVEPTYTLQPPSPSAPAPTPTGGLILPTPLPLPGSGITPVGVTDPQVTSAPVLGSRCQVYVTYSGAVASNKLSLRAQPAASAVQVFRVPNNTQVLLVPASQEVEADGYHWLNMIYVDATLTRYEGWMARDSYAKNGVRDPTIATLRPTNAQADC